MPSTLAISSGHCSDKGPKPINQDFHGLIIPKDPLLGSKGIAVAIADGVSSSEVSQEASATSVMGFLQDYYCTSEAWSVSTSVQRVLHAMNHWLYAQNRSGPYRYNVERGYVCTFSALVFKSATAHMFYLGDSRIYRLNGRSLEQLSEDHRTWLSRDQSYLNRALGMRANLELDYRTTEVQVGDVFLLATDGIYDFLDSTTISNAVELHSDDLDLAAQVIVNEALAAGSDDNLTIQIVRVDCLPLQTPSEVHRQASDLPFPPELHPRMQFDSYQIIRNLHHSHRSHVYLAVDEETEEKVVLKLPSVAMRENPEYLESLLMEEWVARRVDNVHLLKASAPGNDRNYIYTASEYIEGQALGQWINDNSQPPLETVRRIIEQIGRGIQALHRQEILHQDLRPDNIMIDNAGTVKIIDFGSVRVAGIAEIEGIAGQRHIRGTMQYTAPEYFLGELGTTQSDIFSLGVIAYQMISGRQPYGTNVARATTPSAQYKLRYTSLRNANNSIPSWVDGAIRKAVHPNPQKRYAEISEFVHDLRNPNPNFVTVGFTPLIQRNPLVFWKGVSLILLTLLLLALGTHPLGSN